jgi:hypothetical protein
LSYAEIADRLDSSEQVVRGLIARARASVRRAAAALVPWPLLRWLPGGLGGNASTAVESGMTRIAGIAHVTVAAALTGTLAVVGVHAATSSKPELLTRAPGIAGQSAQRVALDSAGTLPAPDQAFTSPFASPATGAPVSANPQAPSGSTPAAPGAQSWAPAASPAESTAAANAVQDTAQASGAAPSGTDPNATPADATSVDPNATPVDPNATPADPTATDPTATPPPDQAPVDTSGAPPPDQSSAGAPSSDTTAPTDTTSAPTDTTSAPTDTTSAPTDTTASPPPDQTSTPAP